MRARRLRLAGVHDRLQERTRRDDDRAGPIDGVPPHADAGDPAVEREAAARLDWLKQR